MTEFLLYKILPLPTFFLEIPFSCIGRSEVDHRCSNTNFFVTTNFIRTATLPQNVHTSVYAMQTYRRKQMSESQQIVQIANKKQESNETKQGYTF